MKNIKKIAFDFDGVIADTNKEKEKWLARQGIFIQNTDKSSFYQELREIMEEEHITQLYREMAKHIFIPQVLEKTQPVKNAILILQELSKSFQLSIITARTESMLAEVRKWLAKHGIEKNITNIISSSYEEKQNICLKHQITFLCDDDIRHIRDSKIETRVLFGKTKNLRRFYRGRFLECG